jgi:hypothetical protein
MQNYIDREELRIKAKQYVAELDRAVTAHDVIVACQKFAKVIDPTGTYFKGNTGAFQLDTQEPQQSWRKITKPKCYGDNK